MFETELNYFIENQEELVKKYNGKQLIIRGTEIVGAFDTVGEAYTYGQKNYGLGNFMLQKCIPGPDAYTVTLPSVWV